MTRLDRFLAMIGRCIDHPSERADRLEDWLLGKWSNR